MKNLLYQRLSNILELTHSHDNKKNIASMEGIRGVAVFLVFIVHYAAVLEEHVGINQQVHLYNLYSWLRNIGSVGVDLFFILSGFLIYGTIISKKRPFLPYMERRVIRIYPTYIVVFIFYLALSILVPESNKIPGEIGKAISYLLQSFLVMPPLVSDIKPLMEVAWTLSYEMFFYIMTPFFVGLLQLRKWQANQRILFFLLLTIMGYLYCFYYHGHIRLLMFVAGIILFEVINKPQHKKVTPFLGVIAFVLSLVAIIQLMVFKIPHGTWWRQVIIYVGFFMLCYECFTWQTPGARIFSFTPLRWLGNMSYSYYLIHGLTVQFVIILSAKFYFTTPLASSSSFFIFGIIVFLLSLVPAFFLFVFIEKPYSLAKKK